MLDKSFIEKIEGLVVTSQDTKEIGGLTYSNSAKHLVVPPKTEVVKVSSLSSLIDLVNVDGLGMKSDGSKYVFKVESPTKVVIMKAGRDAFGRSELYASVDVEGYMNTFPFGQTLDLEKFIVKVQTCFGQSHVRDDLLQAVSKVTTQDEGSLEDNGISQSVQSKKGVVLKEFMSVPNPVRLLPYRTFPEITLSEDAYIFRVGRFHDGKPSFTLHASESNYWQMECMTVIKNYIKGAQHLEVI